MLNFYDFEVYKNLWCVTIINPSERVDVQIVNDKERLEQYYEEHKNEIWIGYNSRNYDQYILKAILCGFDPKEVNDFIILQGKKGWQYSKLLRQFPLNDFDIGTIFYGLKQLEGYMGNDIRETEIPFDYDGEFTPEMIERVLRYNRHDVEQTIEVFLRRKVEFDAQLSLIKMFNLPLSNISKSQAQLAATILNARQVKTFDEWEIRLPETLQLKKYKQIAAWFMDSKNHDSKAKLDVLVAGVPHTFAWGGVHGALKQFEYTCRPDELLVMADVSQLYPCLMLVYRLLSRGCPDTAYDILDHTIATSIRLKEEGKKAEREPYKRFNNIIYGAEGDQTNAMYDPLHRNLVCVFGQLLILDLIEKLEPLITLIQSNTDGIFFRIKRKDFDKVDDIVYEWEQRTGLSMTFDLYRRVVQKDVNNYVVIDYDGKYKSKGAYVKKLNDLDNDLPIVNKAMIDYITKGVPVERTIGDCQELIQFQKIVKVSSKYAFGWHNYRRQSDKTFRVFASKSAQDSFIGKCKKAGATVEKFANTPEHCFVWNDSVKDCEVPSKLDRIWYVDLARDRLNQFGVLI